MRNLSYIIISLLVVGIVIWLIMTPGKPGKLDDFAKCIKNSGATFYGAFWCPYCQAQKARFGKSAKYLPYVECSTPDGKGQLQVCKDAGVMTYPTWQFGTTSNRITGNLELEDLVKKTSCPLTQYPIPK